jgi:hypothetical protein
MRDEEPVLRGKSPPMKQFYPRYLQKSNKSTKLFSKVQELVRLRVRDAFETLKIHGVTKTNFV